MAWKVTFREHWEEVEPPVERIEVAWWLFLFGLGILVGAVLF